MLWKNIALTLFWAITAIIADITDNGFAREHMGGHRPQAGSQAMIDSTSNMANMTNVDTILHIYCNSGNHWTHWTAV